jgi:hypothetical protein
MPDEPPPTRLRFRVVNKHSSRLDWIGTMRNTYTRGELEGRAMEAAERAIEIELDFEDGRPTESFARDDVERPMTPRARRGGGLGNRTIINANS